MTTHGRSRSTESEIRHAPVLAAEVVSMLSPGSDGLYVDCTVGLGGHTAALLAAGAGKVLGLDRDEHALAIAAERLKEWGSRVELVHADYRDLGRVTQERSIAGVSGILVDFGVSSMQLDDPARGFSFRSSGPLDMRMDQSRGESLASRLESVDDETLADVIYRFGEERRSRRVARAILAARDRGELRNTADLASAARRGAGGGEWQRIDPATRTFQGLRIWVNAEHEGLDEFIATAVGLLRPGGRLAAIAFNTLEDRIVKHAVRRLRDAGVVTAVTRRPVQPGDEEMAANPRARSAKLRVVERVA
jgi:16S rRNA (cytosine1402-N4)-methyltransferase